MKHSNFRIYPSFKLFGQYRNSFGMGQIQLVLRALIIAGFGMAAMAGSHAVHAEGTSQTHSFEPGSDTQDRWNFLREALFGDKEIIESDSIVRLEAPGRALDPARVPVAIFAPSTQNKDNYIRKLHVIVDANPVPVAAIFDFVANNGWASIDTELRVNEYSNIRVVAEMSDGSLHMNKQFIKAAGGCSAPPSSYDRSNTVMLGKFNGGIEALLNNPKVPALARFRLFHPNASGMQFDQMTRTYIPAYYVHTIIAEYNDEVLFKVDTNFSMSQDPVLGFDFVPTEPGKLTIKALDSKGAEYTDSWDVKVTAG